MALTAEREPGKTNAVGAGDSGPRDPWEPSDLREELEIMDAAELKARARTEVESIGVTGSSS